MKYENTRNHKVGTLVEQNDKTKTVILEFEDGTSTAVTFSTLKRWWKKLEDAEVPKQEETKEEIVQEEAKEMSQEAINAVPDALKKFIPGQEDADIAGDGTPLAEVGKEIAEQAKEKSKKSKKEKKLKKEKAPKIDLIAMQDKVRKICADIGYTIKTYDKQPRFIVIYDNDKHTSCTLYIGNLKCFLAAPLKFVPDSIKPDRIRNCPLSAAIDISYDMMEFKLKEIIPQIKVNKKKEEK